MSTQTSPLPMINEKVTLNELFDGDQLIDEDAFLDAPNDVRVWFPGDVPEAVASPKQVRSILIGFRSQDLDNPEVGYGNMTLAEIVKRESRRLNISDRQWFSTNAVEKYLAEVRAQSAHLPITEGQQFVAAEYIGAYAGTQPHRDAQVQTRIESLSEAMRNKMMEAWFNVETRGEFQALLTKNTALVGNPAANNARQRRTETQNLVAATMEQGTAPAEEKKDSKEEGGF